MYDIVASNKVCYYYYYYQTAVCMFIVHVSFYIKDVIEHSKLSLRILFMCPNTSSMNPRTFKNISDEQFIARTPRIPAWRTTFVERERRMQEWNRRSRHNIFALVEQ
jgi:hypothetical protein